MENSCQEKGKMRRLAHNQLLFARRNVSSATASLALLLAAVHSLITCQTPLRFPVSGHDLRRSPSLALAQPPTLPPQNRVRCQRTVHLTLEPSGSKNLRALSPARSLQS